MSLSPAQRALCAYLVHKGLLPAEAFVEAPEPATHGPGETLDLLNDAYDWHRNFGLHLLPRHDPAFSEPAYLLDTLRCAEPDDPGWGPAGDRPLSPELLAWTAAWEVLAPGMEVVGFAQTGSDAINVCFDIARRCGRARLHLAGMSQNEAMRRAPGLAFFDGSFGGGRGEAAGMNTLFSNSGAPNFQAWCLPDCSVPDPDALSTEQAAALSRNETFALNRLTQQAQDTQRPLGAIYLEVIQGARGVYFYRPAFLAALRQLADHHGVPIVDDEVLTVARTGRFFAFEHYPDFAPDFVAFGKGLEIAGIARVARGDRTPPCMQFAQGYLGFVTARYPSRQQLLKSRQILLAIASRGLMAASVRAGSALVSGLRGLEEEIGLTPTTSGRGVLIGTSHLLGVCALPAVVRLTTVSSRPRLLPPLTLELSTVSDVVDAARDCLHDPDAQLVVQPPLRGMPEVESLANPLRADLPYRR